MLCVFCRHSQTVFVIMTIIIIISLLASLLPHLTFTGETDYITVYYEDFFEECLIYICAE